MNGSRGLRALFVLSLLSGCAQSRTLDGDAGGDALERPHGLIVSGFVMIDDHPSIEEARTFGSLLLFESGHLGTAPNVTGAHVTFNGVEATERDFEGQYRTPLDAIIEGAEPGGHITLVVEHPTLGSATVEFDCPADFVVTAPIEGDHVSIGVPVGVDWTGRVLYGGISESAAQIAPWNAAENRVVFFGGSLDAYASVRSETGPVMVTPQASDATGYVVDLSVTGDAGRAGEQASADCILTHRVHVVRD